MKVCQRLKLNIHQANPRALSVFLPISTNLTKLSLFKNQITDIKPLSSLTNLTNLWLDNNQKLTDKTCPVQPESIGHFGE